jgi:SAM-dependent methyltransferase
MMAQTYRQLVEDALARDGLDVLHAGCDRDKHQITWDYRARGRVVGIDLNPRAAFHSRLVVGSIEDMRGVFADASFDVICCENVVEHLADPHAAFCELARVLRPGGRLLVQTPNFMSYKALAAWLLPHAIHIALGRYRHGVAEPEMWPTLYRCNTARQLMIAAAEADLIPTMLIYKNNGATWLKDVPLLGAGLRAWHRALDQRALAWARCTIVAVFRRSCAAFTKSSLSTMPSRSASAR